MPASCCDSGRVHPNPFFQQTYAFTELDLTDGVWRLVGSACRVCSGGDHSLLRQRRRVKERLHRRFAEAPSSLVLPFLVVGLEAQRSQDDIKRYLNLEEPIRDVTYMAGIAHDLAYELLGLETPETEEVILRMSKRQRGQLFFAINKAHCLARDLEALYYRQNGEAGP